MPRSTINGTAIDLDGKEMILDADQDTTITSDTDDQIDFKTGGSDRVVINSSGNMGVGVTSPSYKLDVSSTVQIRVGESLRLQNAAGNAVALIQCAGSGTNSDLTIKTNDTEHLRIDHNGHVTMPLQPAFLVRPTSAQTNLAINTDHQIVFGTERFDQNGDFASNTFTAPVTGKYRLNLNIYFQDMPSDATYVQTYIITSNRTYYGIVNPTAFDSTMTYMHLAHSVLADMDASDTVTCRVRQSGGTASLDYVADTNFSGYLVC